MGLIVAVDAVVVDVASVDAAVDVVAVDATAAVDVAAVDAAVDVSSVDVSVVALVGSHPTTNTHTNTHNNLLHFSSCNYILRSNFIKAKFFILLYKV